MENLNSRIFLNATEIYKYILNELYIYIYICLKAKGLVTKGYDNSKSEVAFTLR